MDSIRIKDGELESESMRDKVEEREILQYTNVLERETLETRRRIFWRLLREGERV